MAGVDGDNAVSIDMHRKLGFLALLHERFREAE